MFGGKKTAETEKTQSTQTSAMPTSSGALNSLVAGTVVEGNITAENDIRIDGTVKGNITCKAKIIIGSTGFIEGEVKCQNAVVEGKFYGKMRVTDLLAVKENAEVVGDIQTGKLSVSPGAVFNVTCNMKDNSSANGAAKTVKEAEFVGKAK